MTSDSNQSSGRKVIMGGRLEAFRLNRNAENPTQWNLFKFVLFRGFVALPDFFKSLVVGYFENKSHIVRK